MPAYATRLDASAAELGDIVRAAFSAVMPNDVVERGGLSHDAADGLVVALLPARTVLLKFVA